MSVIESYTWTCDKCSVEVKTASNWAPKGWEEVQLLINTKPSKKDNFFNVCGECISRSYGALDHLSEPDSNKFKAVFSWLWDFKDTAKARIW